MCDTRAVHASLLTRQFYTITFVFFFFFRLSVSFFDVIVSTKFKVSVFSFLLFVRLCRLCAFVLSSSLSSSDHYIELFVGKIERAPHKKGEKNSLFRVWVSESKKNVFSLSKLSFVSSSHFIHLHRGLHISLSSREVKTTTNDFYDDLDDDVFYLPFFFFSLFLSLSLSLFLFVWGNERIQFSDRFNICDTMIEFWSEDCCTLLLFITSRNDLTTTTFLSRRNEHLPFACYPPLQKERIKERWPRNAKPPS